MYTCKNYSNFTSRITEQLKHTIMKRIIVLLASLLIYMASSSQVVVLHTVAAADGALDKNARYAFCGYARDSAKVYINMNDSTVSFGDNKFMIMSNPKVWDIQRTYKYCTFWGYDADYHKVYIKLFRYDGSTRSKICVFSKDKAWRFIGNE